MEKTNLFTVGFTKKTAQEFFTTIKNANIIKIIDIRLNNVSQLAGFAKKNDLIYFLKEICDCDYIHIPQFAPTQELLDGYKKKQIDWKEYDHAFKKLISERSIENLFEEKELNNACLLCSEPTPKNCHRRLVADYLKSKFQNIEIIHL